MCLFVDPTNKQGDTAKERWPSSYVSRLQTTLNCSSLPASLCFYWHPERANFHWLGQRGKTMCTHTLYALSQPPAGFLCRHLEGRPGLRTLQHGSLHPQWWPTKTCFLLNLSIVAPTRVTAVPGIRHNHSGKFSPCPLSLVREKAIESSHPSRLAEVWPGGGGEGDRRASP